MKDILNYTKKSPKLFKFSILPKKSAYLRWYFSILTSVPQLKKYVAELEKDGDTVLNFRDFMVTPHLC